MKKILVVDDEKSIVKGIKFSLEQDDMKVEVAYDGETALELAKANHYDMILLDIMLPGFSGLEVCQMIREFSDVPIIMLTAKGDDMDKILGLEYGADDYITKPCGAAELSARIRVALRNAQKASGTGTGEFSSRGVRVDYGARRVFAGGNEVSLTQNEYNILALLTLNSGKMLTYREIIKAVWGDYSDRGSIKRLQVNIANIRKKLGAEIITNVPGVGYRAE